MARGKGNLKLVEQVEREEERHEEMTRQRPHHQKCKNCGKEMYEAEAYCLEDGTYCLYCYQDEVQERKKKNEEPPLVTPAPIDEPEFTCMAILDDDTSEPIPEGTLDQVETDEPDAPEPPLEPPSIHALVEIDREALRISYEAMKKIYEKMESNLRKKETKINELMGQIHFDKEELEEFEHKYFLVATALENTECYGQMELKLDWESTRKQEVAA